LEDLLDKKKNWMMRGPGNDDRDEMLKRIFKVREDQWASPEKKRKSTVETLFESTSPSQRRANGAPDLSESNSSRDPFDLRGQRDLTGRTDEEKDLSGRGSSRGIIRELDPGQLLNPLFERDRVSEESDGFSRNSLFPQLGQAMFGQRQTIQSSPGANQVQSTFPGLSDPRKLPLRSMNLKDPINQEADGTRFAINPITGRRPASAASQADTTRPSEPVSLMSSSPLGARPEFFGPGRDKPLGGSGLGPTVILPSSAPVAQPKPAVLEIPRPRL
jgi:hypothetical protein